MCQFNKVQKTKLIICLHFQLYRKSLCLSLKSLEFVKFDFYKIRRYKNTFLCGFIVSSAKIVIFNVNFIRIGTFLNNSDNFFLFFASIVQNE
jgi:hypothetical protein